MAKAQSNAGLPLIRSSGSLEDVPFEGGGTPPTKTITIHSMETAFLDLNDNFTFDAFGGEQRERYNIAAAIEGPKVKDADGAEVEGFRAMLFGDADLFADRIDVKGRQLTVYRQTNGGPLPDDVVRWLGGEENLGGAVTDELDKPLQHSSSQDAKWFVLTIIAAPLLVLGGGLVATRRRRKKPASTRSAAKGKEKTS